MLNSYIDIIVNDFLFFSFFSHAPSQNSLKTPSLRDNRCSRQPLLLLQDITDHKHQRFKNRKRVERECDYECFKLPHNPPTSPPPPNNVTTDPTHSVGHIVSYRSLVGIIRVAFPFFEKIPSLSTKPKN